MLTASATASRSLGARLLRHTIYLSSSNLISQVFLAALFLLVGRSGDPQEFGTAVALYSIAMISADVVDFGTTGRIIRDLSAKAMGTEQLGALMSSKIWLGGVVALVWFLAGLATSLSLVTVVSMALLIVTRTFEISVFGLLQASRQFAAIGLFQILDRAVALIAGASLAVQGVSAAMCLAGGLSLGAVVAVSMALGKVRLDLDRPRLGMKPYPRLYWRYGRSFAASGIVTDLQVLDTVIVAAVGGPVAAGYFALGARLTGPFTVLASSFSTALVPPVASAAARGESLLPFIRRAAVITMMTAGALSLVFALAPTLMLLTFGGAYIPSVPVVRIYAVAALVICASQPIAALLQASGEARAVALILTPGVLLGLGLIAVGASVDGPVGGALGFLMSTVVMFALLLHRGRHSNTLRADRPSRGLIVPQAQTEPLNP